jgi:hypothetical protein
MSYYFNQDGFILSNTGDPWRGKGDLAFRSAHYAMVKKDYLMLERLADLLMKPARRWPTTMDHRDGPKYEHRKAEGFRSMTRDPYIIFYAACVEMDRKQFIEVVKPPWYIFSPSFNLWRRYLITGRRGYFKAYEWTARVGLALNPNLPMFAVYLACIKAWIAQSDKVQERLRKFVPENNLACYQLTQHPLAHHHEMRIRSYIGRKGFVWQGDPWRTDWLPGGEFWYMDKEVLMYFYNRNKQR